MTDRRAKPAFSPRTPGDHLDSATRGALNRALKASAQGRKAPPAAALKRFSWETQDQ